MIDPQTFIIIPSKRRLACTFGAPYTVQTHSNLTPPKREMWLNGYSVVASVAVWISKQ